MGSTLLDGNQLEKEFPALTKWRRYWLIRTRRIPVVRIGRRFYFDSQEIREWIEKNKIPVENGGEK